MATAPGAERSCAHLAKEFLEALPVIWQQRVPAGTEMVAKRHVAGLARSDPHLLDVRPRARFRPDLGCGDKGQVGTGRIGPEVLLGGGDVYLPGCRARDEMVLVQCSRAAPRPDPVRKGRRHLVKRFPDRVSGGGGAGTTRIVRKHRADSRVIRGRP